MKRILAVLTAVAFLGTTGLVLAHGSGSGGTGTGTSTGTGGGGKPGHPMSPKNRLKRQHRRIKQGIKNGTINKQQAQQLHQEGKDINQERKADLQKDGGKLTSQDRQTLEQQENQRSKEIYNDKHPGGTTGDNTSSSSPSGSTGN